jgi:hypothetical protein
MGQELKRPIRLAGRYAEMGMTQLSIQGALTSIDSVRDKIILVRLVNESKERKYVKFRPGVSILTRFRLHTFKWNEGFSLRHQNGYFILKVPKGHFYEMDEELAERLGFTEQTRFLGPLRQRADSPRDPVFPADGAEWGRNSYIGRTEVTTFHLPQQYYASKYDIIDEFRRLGCPLNQQGTLDPHPSIVGWHISPSLRKKLEGSRDAAEIHEMTLLCDEVHESIVADRRLPVLRHILTEPHRFYDQPHYVPVKAVNELTRLTFQLMSNDDDHKIPFFTGALYLTLHLRVHKQRT